MAVPTKQQEAFSRRLTPLTNLKQQLDLMSARRCSNFELSFPLQAHLSEKSSQRTLGSSTSASSSSYQTPLQPEPLSSSVHKFQAPRRGLRERFIEEFRKNYCPRTSPALVLPTAPTDEDKYSYVDMKRVFLVSCIAAALLTVVVGSWMFARKAPVFAWWAVVVLVIDFPLFASAFLTLLGRPFDLNAHRKLLVDCPLDEYNAPTVDVYLPVCNEPLELLKNTWDHIAQLQNPASKMSVFVLDDGANEAVQNMANRYGYNYLCRANRPELKKAGAGTIQEHMFRIMQPCRDRWGAAICVGSNAVYRRVALAPLGGTAALSSSEDMYTGFYVTTRGWFLKYIPLVLACGVCPDTPRTFFSQQLRWCSSMALLRDNNFWTSSLSVQQKSCYILGFLINISMALPIFLIPLPGPLILWFRPDLFRYYNLFFAFPNLFLGLIALRIWTRGRYTFAIQYVHAIIIYAYLRAFWDLVSGAQVDWIPSASTNEGCGGKSARERNYRYRHMRLLAVAWTVAQNSVLVVAATYRVVVTGIAWFQVLPALVLNALALLFIHRFLVFRHPKG
ncbi:MAG: hypothetical protein Q9186_006638 [Xanthomendoza sp. 1 TL-2023]